MNIFFVNYDPSLAAEALVDKHVVKMILETTQLLCTAHRVLDGDENGILPDQREQIFYKKTHVNHPMAKWVREAVQNYLWAADHLYSLLHEYTYRYNKKHKCWELFVDVQSPPKNLEVWDFTIPPFCMDDEYIISEDLVENYRNYYKEGKKDLHKWTKRTPPQWISSPS